jgi:hypothetical protein
MKKFLKKNRQNRQKGQKRQKHQTSSYEFTPTG